MTYDADALDSLDEDWAISDFDGQTHFSDDGQWIQPIDPQVYTGNSDTNLVVKSNAEIRTTLPGDLPGHFDYLRTPGNDLMRVGRANVDTRDHRPLVQFENPWEPVRQINQRRRRGIRARFDRTVSLGDDAQGVGRDFLNPGEALGPNQSIAAGGYRLTLQTDGNLVLYKGNQALWNSATQGRGGVKAVMQTDGNFVVYNARTQPLFATGTQGRPGARLVLQTDGNLVVYLGKAPIWNSGTWGGVVAGTHDPKSFLQSVGSAVTSVGSAVGSVVSGVARPIGGLITSPAHLVSDIAHGRNVFQSIKDTVKRDLGNVGAVAPYAQAVLSVVPGVGQGVNAAIAAGSAIAHGQPITDALVSGVKGMVPGGPLAQQALDTAYKIAKGGNVVASVAEAARNNLPGGELARRAFDTGLALAHGANLQKTLVQQGTELAKGKAMSLLSDLSPIKNRITGQNAPQFLGDAVQMATALVPTPMANVGRALLSNPALRGLPVEELARRMNVSPQTARDAVASLVSTISKAGAPSVAHMAPAFDLARRIGTGMTFDQAMAHYASHMAPIATSPDMRRARPLAMQWFRTAQGFVPHISEAMGLDSTGTAYIVESGDSMSKIATKLVGSSSRVGELIKANPQVKDPNKIFVGQRLNLPASWMAKPAAAPVPPPITTRTSPNAAPAPMPTLPAPVSAATPLLASTMPTISEKAQSSGAAVRAWQNILIRDGMAPAGTADGFFGPNTTSRTKQWQAAHGLGADGVVGSKTWAVALATLPTVVTGAPSSPQASTSPAPVSVPTPFGNLPIPPALLPTSTTIAENPAAPIAQPIPTLPMLPAPTPVLAPAVPAAIPPVGTQLGSTPVIESRQTGPSEVTVTQPPITPDTSSKPGIGGILPIGLVLGALYFVGKGSGSRLL